MGKSEGIWRELPEGVLELIDEETGEVLARQKQNPITAERRKNGKNPVQGNALELPRSKTHHFVLDKHGRRAWVPKGTNPDTLPGIVYPYSETTCSHICRFITEGYRIHEIGQMPDMPPIHVIYRWMARYPEFKNMCKEARRLRGEYYHDEAIRTATESKESRVQSDRLKVETYKWAAERGDPDSYGKQTKVVGDPQRPIAILVDTGIARGPGAAPQISASTQAAPQPEVIDVTPEVPTQETEQTSSDPET